MTSVVTVSTTNKNLPVDRRQEVLGVEAQEVLDQSRQPASWEGQSGEGAISVKFHFPFLAV